MLEAKLLDMGENDLVRITLHGSSGNPALDRACAEILHEYSKQISKTNLLKWIPKTNVTGQGQDYDEKKLGWVVAQGCDKPLEPGSLVYVSVNPGGINHSHGEGEFYYAHNGEATFMLGGRDYALKRGHIYYVASGLQHGVKLEERANESATMELVVLKFSSLLPWIFREKCSLKVTAEDPSQTRATAAYSF